MPPDQNERLLERMRGHRTEYMVMPTVHMPHQAAAPDFNCKVCGYLRDNPAQARDLERQAVRITLSPDDHSPDALITIAKRHGIAPQHLMRHMIGCLARADASAPAGTATIFASEIVNGLQHALDEARDTLDRNKEAINDGRGNVAIANGYIALAKVLSSVLDSVAAQAERERHQRRVSDLEQRLLDVQQARSSPNGTVILLPARRTVGDLLEATPAPPPEIDPLS